MSTVNFIEAMETLKSMFPELDTVTVRDVLDKHGGFMEGAVEELLGISRAKRGMGGGGHGGRGGAYGGDDDGIGGSGGRGDRYGGNDGGFGGSDEPPRSHQMGGYGRGSSRYAPRATRTNARRARRARAATLATATRPSRRPRREARGRAHLRARVRGHPGTADSRERTRVPRPVPGFSPARSSISVRASHSLVFSHRVTARG